MRYQRMTPILAACVGLFVAMGVANAQPDPAGPADPWPEEGSAVPDDGAADDGAADDGAASDGGPPLGDPAAAAPESAHPVGAIPEPLVRAAEAGPPATDESDRLDLPVLFDSATGYLLPAGVILSSLGVDTGGGVSSDLRIGLGDVAEFGIGTTDAVRVRRCNPNCEYDAVNPYPLALFKMGVAEDRLFTHQPAMALGFRKSFERNHNGRSTRIAELYLVASKSLGPNVRLHAGGVFWDASVKDGDDNEVLLHDGGIKDQLRAFGGVELQPLPRSRLMLELSWIPEFRLGEADVADKIALRPRFAWGVRYELASWAMIESGVRIPDIGDINLLDAQIFAQFKVVSHRFSRFLDGIN